MPEIIDWQSTVNPQVVLQTTVDALRTGQVVALPTEVGYVLACSALSASACERLQSSSRKQGNASEDVSEVARASARGGQGAPGHLYCTTRTSPVLLAIASGETSVPQLRDWIPTLGGLGQRLARRLWPGPLALALSLDDSQKTLFDWLPTQAREALGLLKRGKGPLDTFDDGPGETGTTEVFGAPSSEESGLLHLWAPAHEIPTQVLSRFPGPLLFRVVGASPQAEQADRILVDVSDGVFPSDEGRMPVGEVGLTVVQLEGNRWQILRQGLISAELLQRQAICVVAFVCTGNTCRSPLAEALLKKRLADALGCEINLLPNHGFLVISAGLAAMMGGTAAAEAVEVANQCGSDLSHHQSQPLHPDVVVQADYLIGMTRNHVQALNELCLRLGAQPHARLLDPTGADLSDPVGQPLEVYQVCGQQIWRALDSMLAELLA